MSEETFDKVEFLDTPEQLQASLQADTESQPQQTQEAPSPVEEQTQVEQAPEAQNFQQEASPTSDVPSTEFNEEEIETGVFNFLSEKLGREVSSFDDLASAQSESRQLDERIQAIADFVETTGRPPRDWFAYQSLNPSEMDDATAVRINLSADYPNLSSEEINMLVSDKYKLDSDLYSEEEMKLSRLQLKIDASKAKQSIESIRNQYNAPDPSVSRKSLVDDEWVSNMSEEVDSMTGVEFDLGNGKSFTFGLDENYKTSLKDKNARIDDYFQPYIQEDGKWDFDTLNSHRVVVDNIDSIVANAYKQGLGDGQKSLVDRAANVSMDTARPSNNQNVNSVAAQLKQQLGNRGTLNIKI
tara:strand:- start:90 stop:1157 length:1068 start_codon:yes stop_codon:yes gene_type:complete